MDTFEITRAKLRDRLKEVHSVGSEIYEEYLRQINQEKNDFSSYWGMLDADFAENAGPQLPPAPKYDETAKMLFILGALVMIVSFFMFAYNPSLDSLNFEQSEFALDLLGGFLVGLSVYLMTDNYKKLES